MMDFNIPTRVSVRRTAPFVKTISASDVTYVCKVDISHSSGIHETTHESRTVLFSSSRSLLTALIDAGTSETRADVLKSYTPYNVARAEIQSCVRGSEQLRDYVVVNGFATRAENRRASGRIIECVLRKLTYRGFTWWVSERSVQNVEHPSTPVDAYMRRSEEEPPPPSIVSDGVFRAKLPPLYVTY